MPFSSNKALSACGSSFQASLDTVSPVASCIEPPTVAILVPAGKPTIDGVPSSL